MIVSHVCFGAFSPFSHGVQSKPVALPPNAGMNALCNALRKQFANKVAKAKVCRPLVVEVVGGDQSAAFLLHRPPPSGPLSPHACQFIQSISVLQVAEMLAKGADSANPAVAIVCPPILFCPARCLADI